MPRVVCSTIEWVLTKRLSEIISKKGCQEPGIPLVLPNRLSEIIQTVAQMIGITLFFPGISFQAIHFFSRFFSVKIDISFINSIFSGEIKNNPPKKQFFHLLKYIPKKCLKTKLSGELKKYGIFDWTVKNIEKNIIDQSHIVHKTWQHLYRLDL